MAKIYGIATCGSVKNAFKFFKDNGLAYEFIDFKKTPICSNKIKEWLKQVDIDILLNTKGTKYKTLKLKELNLDNKQKLEWIGKENLLIKRPIIEFENRVFVGFDENLYKREFLK